MFVDILTKARNTAANTGMWVCSPVTGNEANGTHLQGYVSAGYDRLVELLGEPISGDVEDKVTTEWVLVFTGPEGERVTATLYDWKEYSLRCRQAARYDWHIGGHDKRAVELVTQLLKE
jgi:hypothetical protein